MDKLIKDYIRAMRVLRAVRAGDATDAALGLVKAERALREAGVSTAALLNIAERPDHVLARLSKRAIVRVRAKMDGERYAAAFCAETLLDGLAANAPKNKGAK